MLPDLECCPELAVNANFFWWDQDEGMHDTRCLKSIGLAVSDHVILSRPGDTINMNKDRSPRLPDAILFKDSGAVEIVDEPGWGYVVPEDVAHAVSGIRIIRNGAQEIKNAPPSINPCGREPRTALALDASGHTLLVLVIEGPRKCGPAQPGDSAGISLYDLATILLDEGAVEAINLDGGGSTALVYWGPPSILSRPTDCYPYPVRNDQFLYQYRPVAINIGFAPIPPVYPTGFRFYGTPIPYGLSVWADAAPVEIGGDSTISFYADPTPDWDYWLDIRAPEGIRILPQTKIMLPSNSGASVRLGPGGPLDRVRRGVAR